MNSRRLSAARQRAEEGENLRLLSWEELRARLAAARDLRREMVDRKNGQEGSFAADAALHLKDFEAVNPKTLGNGKGSGARASGTAQRAILDDRGQDD